MSGKMIKVGGKTSGGMARAFGVSEKGEALVKRVWENALVRVFANDIDGTTPQQTTVFDAREFGFISLRVENQTESALTFTLYADRREDDPTYLKDINGDDIKFTIPAKSVVIVTPDDVPALSYLQYVRLRFVADTVPASAAYVCVRIMAKR